jgi:3-oxoacyl-[acyl-carrier protein] reductase
MRSIDSRQGEKMDFSDRVVLITGGAAGIGKATAQKFAAAGANVSICDVSEKSGHAAVAEIGDRCEFHSADVTRRRSVQQWIERVVEKFDRIDVLVNNAGIVRDKLLVKMRAGEIIPQMSESEFDTVMDVNLKGVFHCTQTVVPVMARQRGGVILNATSIVGMDGNLGQTNYVASKAGVIGMTKVWARELGRYNIRVNAVAPGFTATDIIQSVPEKILEQMKTHTPLGRLGTPEEIANAYLFLASDMAAFITGIVLRVDGGLVIGT